MSPRWLVHRTLRAFARHKLVFLVQVTAFAAVGTLALGARALGLASTAATARITDQGHVVAYLSPDLSATKRGALDAALARLPGVLSVHAVDGAEALARLRREMQGLDGQSGAALDGVEADFLPASVEIAIAPGGDLAARTHDVALRLQRLTGVTAVDEMGEGRERLAAYAALARRLASLVAGSAALAGLMLMVGLLARVRARQANACAVLAQLGATPAAVRVPEGTFAVTTAVLGAVAALAIADRLTTRLLGVPQTELVAHPVGTTLAVALGLGLAVGWLAVPMHGMKLRHDDGAR